jgi:nucleoside-diphosphate-sugar epimerase
MGGIGYITAIGADIMRNSVSINLNMLQAAQQCSVPEYFYSSSACVYPEYLQTEAEVSPLKETDAYPAQPDQFYGWERR